MEFTYFYVSGESHLDLFRLKMMETCMLPSSYLRPHQLLLPVDAMSKLDACNWYNAGVAHYSTALSDLNVVTNAKVQLQWWCHLCRFETVG